MNKFIIDGRYADMLAWHGLNIEEVLRKAQLPGDAFRHQTVTMSEEQYFRFLDAVGALMKDPALPIQIATTNKIETFSPPIYIIGISTVAMFILMFAGGKREK